MKLIRYNPQESRMEIYSYTVYTPTHKNKLYNSWLNYPRYEIFFERRMGPISYGWSSQKKTRRMIIIPVESSYNDHLRSSPLNIIPYGSQVLSEEVIVTWNHCERQLGPETIMRNFWKITRFYGFGIFISSRLFSSFRRNRKNRGLVSMFYRDTKIVKILQKI